MNGKTPPPRVLVMEDDLLLAASLETLLRSLPCEVVLLTSEEASLDYIPEDIHLLLVDLDSSACSSGPLLDRLLHLYPSAAFVLLVPRNTLILPRLPRLAILVEKPLRALALVQTIKNALASPALLPSPRAPFKPPRKTNWPPSASWSFRPCNDSNANSRPFRPSSSSRPNQRP